jgi:hypothetical protein
MSIIGTNHLPRWVKTFMDFSAEDGDESFLSNILTGQHPKREEHYFVTLPDGSLIGDPEVWSAKINPSASAESIHSGSSNRLY